MSDVLREAASSGFWIALRLRLASSSVASICLHMDAPCVLARLAHPDPEGRQCHHAKH